MLICVSENFHVKNRYLPSCALVLICCALSGYGVLSASQQASLKTFSKPKDAARRYGNQASPVELNNQAVGYINANKFASAICLLEKCIEIDPSYELGLYNLQTAYWNLALVQYKNKEYKQAHATVHRLKPILNKMKNKPEVNLPKLHYLVLMALRN